MSDSGGSSGLDMLRARYGGSVSVTLTRRQWHGLLSVLYRAGWRGEAAGIIANAVLERRGDKRPTTASVYATGRAELGRKKNMRRG